MLNYLEELNESQYEAVSSEAQYLRIVAGAGSGKTRVLTYRIAYLIEKMGFFPWDILAITFTNKVAIEMKERAAKLVDVSIKDLTIKTFHSFCAYFLRREINECLDYPSNFIIYDEVDSKEVIKKACELCSVKKGDKFADQIISYIYSMKSIGKYPNDIKVGDFKIRDEQKCVEVYKMYESLKYDDRALDFDDLIMKTIQVLKNFPEIKKRWQKYYKHILIDEFQDTNDLQYELVKLLMNDETSLYVVGDPDQTIYTWRGANQKIIMDLNKLFPSLKTIILDKNYRSTKRILDCSNKLIKLNKYRVEKNLITDNPIGEEIKVFKAFTRNEEADWVVKRIVELKASNSDFSYNDVAILYRNSFISSSFENKLMTSRIPYSIYGGIRFYQRKEVKLAISYFRNALNLEEDFSFYKIINEPKRKIGEQTILLLQEESKKNNLSAYEYIKNIDNFETELKSSSILIMSKLIEKLEYTHLRLIENEEVIVEVLKDLLDSVDFSEYILSLEDGEDRLQNVKALLDQVKSFFKENQDAKLENFLEDISLASSQDEVKNIDKVKMMTIHTAKGLEFNYVFVVGLNEEIFPSKKTMLENPYYGLEEERRLCYVAFTRAKKQLFVTCNTDFSYIYKTNSAPSRFFKEAGLDFIARTNSNSTFKNYKFMATNNLESISSCISKMNENNRTTINWKIGDRVRHKNYGDGKIIDIIDDILVIDFYDSGIKKIISYYKGIERINSKEIDV